MSVRRRAIPFLLTTLVASLAACMSPADSASTGGHAESTGQVASRLAVVTNGAFQNVYVYPNPSQQNWEDHLKGLTAPDVRSDNDQFSRKAIDAFTERLMTPGSPTYFDSLFTDYGIYPPQFFGSAVVSQACVDAAMQDARAAGGVLQGSTIRSLSNCHVAGMDPAPQLNLIFSPEIKIAGARVAGNGGDMCTEIDAAGQHPAAWHGGGVNTPNFTVMPTRLICNGSFGAFTQSMSHELVELLSDPGITMSNEVGDHCEKRPDTYMTWAGFSISRYWSNASNTCLPLVDESVPPPPGDAWIDASEAPLVRFTGDVHDLSVPILKQVDVGHAVTSLNVVISTGNDDLRGGGSPGDNCDVGVQLTSGQVIRLTDVNHGQTWAGWTKNTVSVPLPAGLKGGDVKGVTLHTGFGGGIGGDNWNVERVQLVATVLPLPPPTVNFVFPSVGDPLGGTNFRIDGANFEVDGSTRILIGDVDATNVTCATNSCTATAPAGSGIQPIRVIVDGVTATAATSFSYSPSIISLSEDSGAVGDTVMINGVGLGGATSISFGPYQAQTFTCWTQPSSCRVTVPGGTGPVDVRVTVGGRVTPVTAADSFRYASLAVTGISPSSGPVTGATDVTIQGSGFDTSPGATQVFFNGVPGLYVNCSDSTSCVVRSPAWSQPGPVEVTLTSFGQTSLRAPWTLFTYNAGPKIKSFMYSGQGDLQLDGSAPAGGAVVTITCNDPSLMAPTTVTVPAGLISAPPFSLPIALTKAEKVTLTASYDGSSATIVIEDLTPPAPPPPIKLVTSTARLITAGSSATLTITLGSAAPAGGAVIALTSTPAGDLSIPASVTVPAGTYVATATVTSAYSGALTNATVTATYSGASSTQSIIVGTVVVPPHGGGGGGTVGCGKGQTCQ